jgi:SAM-dependent methyltransferase
MYCPRITRLCVAQTGGADPWSAAGALAGLCGRGTIFTAVRGACLGVGCGPEVHPTSLRNRTDSLHLLNEWLDGLDPQQRVLDLGAGAGSFSYETCSAAIVAVDLEFGQELPSGRRIRVCADSSNLPFAPNSFDLVICHHSLEHFQNLVPAIREIRRILKPDGRLFVSVPDGYSFSDGLYRLLLAGGGHLQRFSFEQTIRLIESETLLHLVSWKKLYTSFIYVDKRNFLPAPRGPLPGPFPRRMRWLGRLPRSLFSTSRFLLNVWSRLIDRCGNSSLSLYGWAFAFDPLPARPNKERSFINVCMHCGFAAARHELSPIAIFLYRCRLCGKLNPLFGPAFEETL